MIAEYARTSQRLNPYEAKDEVLLWSYAVYSYRMDKKSTKRGSGRGLDFKSYRAPPFGQTPHSFTFVDNYLMDNRMPVWYIPFETLKKAYDEARFSMYLKAHPLKINLHLKDPKEHVFQLHANRTTYAYYCYHQLYKRRIFWLYPYDGMYLPWLNKSKF